MKTAKMHTYRELANVYVNQKLMGKKKINIVRISILIGAFLTLHNILYHNYYNKDIKGLKQHLMQVYFYFTNIFL